MSNDQNKERMNPISHEIVEVDGVYRNEWGREVTLKRGQEFPADVQLGTATWELIGLEPAENVFDQESPHRQKPRLHVDRGDK
ncbi:hypothetical protein [Marinicrinis lubricantis]|uniref:Transposase n=1 Tax=Marinicrinis lubricantis TaxID=2086470 RepID=A0ABW1IRB0_9BACL